MSQNVLVNLKARLKPVECMIETLLELLLIATSEVLRREALDECVEARLDEVVRASVVVDAILDVRASTGREINLNGYRRLEF